MGDYANHIAPLKAWHLGTIGQRSIGQGPLRQFEFGHITQSRIDEFHAGFKLIARRECQLAGGDHGGKFYYYTLANDFMTAYGLLMRDGKAIETMVASHAPGDTIIYDDGRRIGRIQYIFDSSQRCLHVRDSANRMIASCEMPPAIREKLIINIHGICINLKSGLHYGPSVPALLRGLIHGWSAFKDLIRDPVIPDDCPELSNEHEILFFMSIILLKTVYLYTPNMYADG